MRITRPLFSVFHLCCNFLTVSHYDLFEMLNKPCLAPLAQTCMKCKMTEAERSRNVCGVPLLFDFSPSTLCKAFLPQRLEKEGGKVKDASSAVPPSIGVPPPPPPLSP